MKRISELIDGSTLAAPSRRPIYKYLCNKGSLHSRLTNSRSSLYCSTGIFPRMGINTYLLILRLDDFGAIVIRVTSIYRKNAPCKGERAYADFCSVYISAAISWLPLPVGPPDSKHRSNRRDDAQRVSMALRYTSQQALVMMSAILMFTINVQHGTKRQLFVLDNELVAPFAAVYRALWVSLTLYLFLKTGGATHPCYMLRAHSGQT